MSHAPLGMAAGQEVSRHSVDYVRSDEFLNELSGAKLIHSDFSGSLLYIELIFMYYLDHCCIF